MDQVGEEGGGGTSTIRERGPIRGVKGGRQFSLRGARACGILKEPTERTLKGKVCVGICRKLRH